MLIAEIEPDLPSKVLLTGPSRFNDLIKQIPGAKFSAPRSEDGTHKLNLAWRAPLTWQVCLALRTTFGAELEIGPELRLWAKKYKESVVAPAMQYRAAAEADIPGFEHLFPYQRAGVMFMAASGRALLADPPGLGKTAQSISALRYLHEQGKDVFPVLVAAPNSTVYSWAREIEKWWPGRKVNVVKGTATQRRKLLEDEAEFYVVNWEGLRNHSRLAPYGNRAMKTCVECGGEDPKVKPTQCQKHEKELNRIQFRSAIGDEIHRIKDGRTATTRALKAATASAEYKIALSGTPIANHPGDLWSPLNWLLPEAYPARTHYVDRFMELSFNPWGGQEITGLKTHMEPEFFAGIDPHLRIMPKEKALPFLPPKVYERRDVEMSPKQAKAYKAMNEDMLAEMDDGNVLVTTSDLQKTLRLLQVASTMGEVESWYETVFNKETGEEEEVLRQKLHLAEPSCKLDAFMEDLEDYEGESIVVFAVSRQLLELLSARLEKQGIKHGMITGAVSSVDRQKHMDDFQEGRTKMILVSTAAGGTGITLTAASIGVFLQRPWSNIESVQAEDRLYRIGSEIHEMIRIIDYVTKDTVEELVFPALQKKGAHLEKIVRSKEVLKKMLELGELDEDKDTDFSE
jgi:SNF2 family DNA or RNA helicase